MELQVWFIGLSVILPKDLRNHAHVTVRSSVHHVIPGDPRIRDKTKKCPEQIFEKIILPHRKEGFVPQIPPFDLISQKTTHQILMIFPTDVR